MTILELTMTYLELTMTRITCLSYFPKILIFALILGVYDPNIDINLFYMLIFFNENCHFSIFSEINSVKYVG